MSDCLRWQNAQHRDPVFLGAITWNGLASLMLFGWAGSTVLTQSKSRERGLHRPWNYYHWGQDQRLLPQNFRQTNADLDTMFLASVAVIPIWPGLPFCWGQPIFICHERVSKSMLWQPLCWHGPCEGDPLGKAAVLALMELIIQQK